MLWQPPLAPRYLSMSDTQLADAIHARKQQLGRDVIILGHHYQQDDVIQFADFTGDSFKLSQLAAERVQQAGAKYVIFAGVHFMAESADILTPDSVSVILPDLGAGCSMADMADYDETVEAWGHIHRVLAIPTDDDRGGNLRNDLPREHFRGPVVIPICYMNSSAAIKAFCGRHGGAVCTSSNCDRVFRWALAGGSQPPEPGRAVKVLFLPDQHLGRNTAAAMGYDTATDMAVWDPKHPDDRGGTGGLTQDQIRQATFLLWKGHCSVHKLFRPEHVDQARDQWPGVRVIVHPECDHEVVRKADLSGSTEKIIQALEQAQPGNHWAVGTEVHLVGRLAKKHAPRGVSVHMLSGCQCLCTTMYRIDMPHLLWVLDELAAGRVVNQVRVEPDVRRDALTALDRMLRITTAGNGTPSTPPHAERV